ncbi:MEKHLA domain-containing protein [Actinoplanes sp. NPDC049596]|uniref:MEKHLA domain-containing protein n=1 Tax=unclassified Actinoplanes TaxID=2626549 RepID=UPI00341F835B
MTVSFDVRMLNLLLDSYLKLTGKELVPAGRRGPAAAKWLYEAPLGVLMHDTSPDPLFIYANRTALRLFGYGRDEFIGLPSRLSAGEQDRETRDRLMASVLRDGYTDGYSGPRIRKDGTQFQIEVSSIWNVLDPDAAIVGQAAMIRRWRSQ